MSEEFPIEIISLARAPIEAEFSKRKRVMYVESFDSLKILARRLTRGIILYYQKSENSKMYDIYEVETKYAIFRLKVLIEYKGDYLTEDAVKAIKQGLVEAVVR